MNERDYETYCLVAAPLLENIAPPDLLVYLRRAPEDCAANVAKRGRDYEKAMPRAYLEQLGARYDAWFEAYQRGPKMVLDAARYDFVENEADTDRVLSMVRAAVPQLALLY